MLGVCGGCREGLYVSCQGGPCLTLRTLVSWCRWSVGVVAVHSVMNFRALFCIIQSNILCYFDYKSKLILKNKFATSAAMPDIEN